MPDVKEHKGMALFLLCLVQFMVVLDIAIVNVALPSIQTSLHFSETNLSWVINAYTLTFGGLLLLGGRAADLLGRRRIFIAGLLLFSVASAACGFANSDTTPDHRPRDPGSRGGDGLAGRARDPRDNVRGRPGAQQGTGYLGSDRRFRRCRRRTARRDPHPGAQLVVDLLHQRARRARRDRRGAEVPAREPRRSRHPLVRSRRRDSRDRGHDGAGVRAGADRRPLVGCAAHDRAVRRRVRAAGRASSPPSGGWRRR